MIDLRFAPACRLAALLFVVALALSGCAGGGGSTANPPPSTTPPPVSAKPKSTEPAPAPSSASGETSTTPAEPAPLTGTPSAGRRPRPGYDARVDDLKRVDTSALRGRRIALDPGHGGRFPGSIGVKGLTEAEVNLGVGLHLWGLLVEAGANVHMTRTTDRDFPAPGDSSLRADLAARSDRALPFAAEVFVSIHHNADPGRRNDVNEIQTYYRFDDPLASYDLGAAVHRRLVRNLGIEAERLLPGNFYVIRNADAPAILTESSYLTNPDVEAKLQLASKQRLEAEAIFLGLVDYFARGVPRVVAARTERSAGGDALDAAERPWIVLDADRPLGAARLRFDGADVDTAAIQFTGNGARWRPAGPLLDGTHTVAWTARSQAGGWSRVARDTFAVDLPVARVVFEALPPRDAAEGQTALLTLRALDRHDRPVADTLRAIFTSRVGATMVDTMGVAGAGEARAYARVTGGSIAAFTARVRGAGGAGSPVTHDLKLPLVPPGRAAAWTTGFVRAVAGTTESPVAGAVVSADTARGVANADGFYALASSAAQGATLTARAPGYVTAATAPAGAVRMLAIGGGALRGRKIALDPGGGGADTTGLGLAVEAVRIVGAASDTSAASPDSAAADSSDDAIVMDDSLATDELAPGDIDGRRRAQAFEADANLRVARALREYLEAAGAEVILTRDRPESLTSVDRLRRTEAFAPERVVVIGHRAAAGRAGAGHYFSSPNGKALARRIAARLEERGVVARRRAQVSESASYVVSQTAAVAVSLNLPNAAPLYVDATRGARRLRDEAYALYLALLEDLGGDPKAWRDVSIVAAHGAAPEAGVPVTLDGRWTLITDAKGRVRFDGLPAGGRVTVAADTARAMVTLPVTGAVRMELGAAARP